MSDEILKIVLEKVEKVENKISNAKSMNGGFDKLMTEVEHIKETQSDILDGVRGVKQNLYEPDSGLFSRVKELESEAKIRNAYVKETKPALDFAKELVVWKKHADKEGAEELTRMQDVFYKMEKDAMDAGGASDEQRKKAQIHSLSLIMQTYMQ